MHGENALSDEELKLIESRAEAATVGPWHACVVGRELQTGLNFIEMGSCKPMEVLGGTVADQDFIAHAREDLPRLVSEIRALRRRLTQQR